MSTATVALEHPGGFLAKSVRDQRRAATGWMIGIVAIALLYASLFPSIKASSADLQSYIDKLPDALKNVLGTDYASPAGYLRGEIFSSMGVILLLIYAIGAGARAIAGEEEARSLDLLLSTPLRRSQVLRDKALATVAIAVALGAALFVVLAILGPVFQLHVAVGNLAAACLMLASLACAFGAIALAVGATTGRRVWAIAVAAGIAVVTYILNAVAPTVSALEPLRPLSPFRWYLEPDPLVTGFHPANAAVLLGIAAVGYAIAFVGFTRRDLAA
ncbi:MAG TPA: ABC transporter permease subunit [Actinomycetota bacterium]|nr:ABC transporter permease subunit [Actinomycetota bacterium]